jgi:fucose permease
VGGIATAMLVPLLCFVVVLLFACRHWRAVAG